MRSMFFLALSAITTLAAASGNSFNIPKDGYEFTAGESTTLKWAPSTEGTVTLKLQWGDAFTSSTGTTIASNIANSGSYTWSVPKDIAEHGDYTVEIISDSDPNATNYLPRFSVQGAEAATTTSESTTTPETTTTETSSTSTDTTMTTTTSTSTTTESSSSAAPTSTSTSESSSETPTSTTSTESSSSSTEATETPSSSSSSVPSVDDADNAGMANRVSGGLMALALGVAALV